MVVWYISSPVAGDAIASRWVLVILGNNTPCVVDFISSRDDAFGALVPIPALPEAGNVFCALSEEHSEQIAHMNAMVW